jgi:hypothetical protein
MSQAIGRTQEVVVETDEVRSLVWPIRFTAVAVKSKGRWRFHQMQFSHPTTRFPDVRYVE